MGIEKREKVIDGHTVVVVQFGGRLGFTTKLRILKMLSPAVSGTLAGIKVNSFSDLLNVMEAKMDFSKIGDSVEKLMMSSDEEKTLNLILTLVSSTRIDGKDLSQSNVFDDIFSANYKFLYKVLFFVLEVNYGNLFTMGNIGNLVKEIVNVEPVLPENMTQ